MRSTEEIDIVGLRGKEASVIGEVRWRNKPMDGNILKEIDEFKIPALVEAGVTVDKRSSCSSATAIAPHMDDRPSTPVG